MNAYGAGHMAFEQAQEKYKGNTSVVFLSVGEGEDGLGNAIRVGLGDNLQTNTGTNKKALPMKVVSWYFRMGQGCI